MSKTPQVYLIECIPSIGMPRSMVFIPVPDAKIGPIVVPHGESFLTINSWTGTLYFYAIILIIVLETKSVAYLWLTLDLITTPLLI